MQATRRAHSLRRLTLAAFGPRTWDRAQWNTTLGTAVSYDTSPKRTSLDLVDDLGDVAHELVRGVVQASYNVATLHVSSATLNSSSIPLPSPIPLKCSQLHQFFAPAKGQVASGGLACGWRWREWSKRTHGKVAVAHIDDGVLPSVAGGVSLDQRREFLPCQLCSAL